MLVTRSSCSSVFDTEMVTFTFEEQRVIIRFLHLCGMKPIEIHRQLSETCSDGVMDVKNVRLWVRQFKEGRTSCDVGRSSSKVSFGHCSLSTVEVLRFSKGYVMSYEHQLKSVRLVGRAWPDDTQSYVFPFCIRNILRTFECQMGDVLKPV